jgi:hypothetical protein
MIELKTKKWGNEIGIVLDAEALAALGKVEENETFYLTETPEGVCITKHNPELERQLEIARAFMKERAAALRELAK